MYRGVIGPGFLNQVPTLVISRVISRATIVITVITHIRGLITLLITTLEPPSRASDFGH